MVLSSRIFSIASAVFLLGASSRLYCADSDWYFKVANDSSSRITRIQVSPNKQHWADFDIGNGIKPGQEITLIWDDSTDDEGCVQWIRAQFADGGTSIASKQNFCENLEDAIVFSN